MKTMTAKYPGVCDVCKRGIVRGEKINYFGRGHVEHFNCTEEADAEADVEPDEDEAAGFEPGTLANDRRLVREGLSVVRFASGAVMTQNSRGRCEDAPCCGCCS